MMIIPFSPHDISYLMCEEGWWINSHDIYKIKRSKKWKSIQSSCIRKKQLLLKKSNKIQCSILKKQSIKLKKGFD